MASLAVGESVGLVHLAHGMPAVKGLGLTRRKVRRKTKRRPLREAAVSGAVFSAAREDAALRAFGWAGFVT